MFVIIIVLQTSGLWIGCTDTDTYLGTADIRNGRVEVNYGWSSGENTPDSMMILAVRLINYWKCGMKVSTQNLRGHYFYNAPEVIEPWVDPDADDKEGTNDNIAVIIAPGEPHNGGVDPSTIDRELGRWVPTAYDFTVDHFNLPKGIYNFYTMTGDSLGDVRFCRVKDFLEAVSTGLPVSEIYAEYTPRKSSDRGLVPTTGWTDFNPGYGYIRGKVVPVYFTKQEQVSIDPISKKTLNFRPNEKTQIVDVTVPIQKEMTDMPFTIDSVWLELSGIPAGMTVIDGYLFTDKTLKALSRATLTDTKGKTLTDSENNKALQARCRLHVPSILAGQSTTSLVGNGIMQVAVYLHYRETLPGKTPRTRVYKVQGAGNITQVIKKAKLTKLTSDKKHTVKSTAKATLTIPNAVTVSAFGVKDNTQWKQKEVMAISDQEDY